MRALIAVVCLAVAAQAASLHQAAQAASLYQDEWQAFKAMHSKSYSAPEEETFRQKIFVENSRMIERHNLLYKKGLTTFTMKMNKFGDMLSHEIADKRNGFRIGKRSSSSGVHQVTNSDLPDSVDWRTKGVVTPIKDQGSCGSCYAFSATGALEGQHALKTGELVSLSEQNLVDCSGNYGNYGCHGGFMDPCFDYVQDNGGIDTEASYPYAEVTALCRFHNDTIGATDRGHYDVDPCEEALLHASATVGPISVAIDASFRSFHFYSGGIYDEPRCSPTAVDHAVLVVGYGSDLTEDYWLVKNSWGTDWGEDGYIRMVRNKDNQCGIAYMASYPLV